MRATIVVVEASGEEVESAFRILNGAIGTIGRYEQLSSPIVTEIPAAVGEVKTRVPRKIPRKPRQKVADLAGLFECERVDQFSNSQGLFLHRTRKGYTGLNLICCACGLR
jgi:hypothetical protein